MAAFASVDQLRSFIGDSGFDSARAQLILDAVSDAIRDTLGWTVTEEADRVLTLDGDGDKHLFLPSLRLTAVSSVVEDGKALTLNIDYVWRENGTLTRVAGDPCSPTPWTCRPRAVTVTFTHGYPEAIVPGVFRAVTLDHAAPFTSNPGGALKSETIGQVSLTYADVRAQTKAGDDSRLDRYRIIW